MLVSPAKQSEAEPDLFECVVLDVQARAPDRLRIPATGAGAARDPLATSTISPRTPTPTQAPNTTG